MARNTYANVVATGPNVVATPIMPTTQPSSSSIPEIDDLTNNSLDQFSSNSHPLYLQNLDHPGLILISKKLTGTENYGPWKRSLTIALSAKNKLGIINGTVIKPEESSPLRSQWDRVNDMVISWILNTVSDEISNGMDFVTTAQEVWEELEAQFSSINGHRVYQVLKDIHALEQGEKSVEIYYHKLKNLWDEYAALEPNFPCKSGCKCESHKLQEDREQRKKLLHFLMGLNESFSAARGQILMMSPLPTLAQAFSLIKQEEKQRQGSSIASFIANARATSKPVAAAAYHNTDNAKKQNIKCSYCHKDGHLKESCFKLIGYPPRGRGRGKPGQYSSVGKPSQAMQVSANTTATGSQSTESGSSTSIEQLQQQVSQMAQLMTMYMSQKPTSTPEDHVTHLNMAGLAYSMLTYSSSTMKSLWIIDSGASNHMCCDISLLTDIHIIATPIHIALPNKQLLTVSQVGTVEFTPQLILHQVLYVPQFTCNLLSVSKFTSDSSMSVNFTPTDCVFQDQNQGKVLATGIEQDGLYYLSQYGLNKASSVVSNHPGHVVCTNVVQVSSTVLSSKLWHLRLGHAPNNVLSHISVVDKPDSCTKDCPVCPVSKQSMFSFPQHSNSHETSVFSLLHMDVWGPYNVPTLHGQKYFLTLVDDCSRATWTILLASKQQVFSNFKNFFAYVSTHFGTTIKSVRTDNGSEFINHLFSPFLAGLGISHQKSCVNTPQQNARVERKHRHLLEVARALRFQSGLPLKYWGECLLTATYIINLLPTPVLHHKCPYEVLHNKPPDYSLLKAFGCLCYASTHSGDKFSPRAIQCVFLGYPCLQKGYKLLRLDNHSVFTSRHVKFLEHIFPYHNMTLPIPKSTNPSPGNSYTFLNWLHHTQDSPSNVPIVSQSQDTSDQFHSSSSESVSIPTDVTHSPDVTTDVVPTTSTDIVLPDKVLRKSTRPKHQPSWWQDFQMASHVNSVVSVHHPAEFLDPFSLHLSQHSIDTNNQMILSHSHAVFEPKFYHQAIKDPKWVQAINTELSALEANNTWTLMPLPSDKKSIGCKWVFKVKYLPNGDIDKYKARLVAKGFTQSAGIDYHDTFAPVVKLVTVRCLLAIAVAKGWFIEQLDVNNAFLHGDLEEDVYMDLPLGYSPPDSKSNWVCKLNKSLYGLRQASRQWFAKLASFLLDAGYKQSMLDHSLFTLSSGSSYTAIVIYVDDIIVSGNDFSVIQSLKNMLNNKFSIKDLGPIKYYLGLEVQRNNIGLHLSQHKFIMDLLHSVNMQDCKPLSVPIDPHVKLYDNDTSGPLLPIPSSYRALVGKLLYLTSTRPDISFVVQSLSQFLHAPRFAHMEAVKRVLRYLKLTSQHGLFFPATNSLQLQGFSDSDWGGNPVDRRSVGGYCFTLGPIAVSWRSKKQSLTSKSSGEAEYRALADASCEIMWLKNLLADLQLSITDSVPLFCDNKAAIDLTANPVYHARTKHIEIDCHFIREKIAAGILSVQQIVSKENTSDVFTKGLGKASHWSCCHKLGLSYCLASSVCGGDNATSSTSSGTIQDVQAIAAANCISTKPTATVRRGANEIAKLVLANNLAYVNNKSTLPFSQTEPYICN